MKALDRDSWRCVLCHKAGRLEVDHIQGLESGGAPYDLENLQSLCVACHLDKSNAERGAGIEVLAWRAYVRQIASDVV